MSLRARLNDRRPVTTPLVLNPLMARMAEAAGFPAGYLGGGPPVTSFTAWKQVYADLAEDFGGRQPTRDWSATEHEMLQVIDIERLLAVERATVAKGRT